MYTLVLNMICLFLLLSQLTFSQQDSVRMKLLSFIEKAEQFHSDYPDEKVYLHLDNTAYFLGEKLRFKAYVVESPFHQLSSRNRILHVELLSPEGNIVREQKLKITNGQTFGEFQLDTTLFSGYFEIRAYTRTMLNFEDSARQDALQSDSLFLAIISNSYFYYYPPEVPGIFSRVIPVYEKPEIPGDYNKQYIRPRKRVLITQEYLKDYAIDSEQPLSRKSKDQLQPFSLRITFYPEGGHLVNGLLSRVAFKATTPEGKDIQISGTILDSNQDTIIPFRTTHRGMGTFLFSPEKGKTYSASCRFRQEDYSFPLPVTEEKGYSLSVYNQPNNSTLVQVRQTVTDFDTLGFTIICGGKICIFQEVILTRDNPWNLKIKTDILPAGVNNCVLFDKTGKSLCERKIFVQPQSKDLIQIKLSAPGKKYLPQEKINLCFNVSEKDSIPVNCTLSLAIRDSSSETETFGNGNILTNLLLSSEIRGFISNVAYYFEKKDLKHQQDLDLLMMVQGWSRCSWEHLCGRLPFTPRYTAEKSLNFEGKIKTYQPPLKKKQATASRNFYKPAAGTQVTLELMKDTLIVEGKGTTNSKGEFSFLPDNLEGEWQYFLKVKPPVQKPPQENIMWDPRILLNLKLTPGLKSYSYYEQNKQDIDPGFLTRKDDTLYQNIILEDAVIKGQQHNIPLPPIKLKVQDIYDELNPSGLIDNDAVLLLICLVALEKTHQSPGYGVMIYNTSKGIVPGRSGGPSPASPYYWADSVIIHTDYKIRKQYLPYTYVGHTYPWIGYLKFKNKSEIFPDFVLEFKENPDKNHHPFWGMRRGTFQGYTPAKEYYTEDFTHKPLPGKPDYRRVLYWNPMVKTDSSGQAEVTFYNNSKATTITINAETITQEGKVGIFHAPVF